MEIDKKSRERLLLSEVAELDVDFPSGTIIGDESPDFLIKLNNQVLGIEIVDYIRGQTSGESNNRRNEMVWKNIADKARVEFESKYSIPLVVQFFWYPHRHPRQTDVKQLAGYVSSLVANHIPSEYFAIVQISNNELGNTLLERFLRSMTICKVKKQSLWSFVGGGFIEVQVDEIQWLLSSKNDKVNGYLKKCDSVWLLIVANGRYISSNVDLPKNVLGHNYQSQFERVVFYDRFSRKVFPLTVHH
jgi:hypothetical protein